MEKPNTPYNYHLDKTVLLLFAITFLTFGSLFAYKLVTREDCVDVHFKTDANAYRVGELIRFTSYSEGAKSWKWNFNDSTDIKTERNPYHTFSKPGKYDVRLTVNKKCEVIKTITIEEKEFVLDSTKFPSFEFPKETMVGEKIKVRDITSWASTWEWRFGETVAVDSYEKEAEYTYKESGLKTISLVVNSDMDYIKKVKIKVLPKPLPKEDIGFVKIEDSEPNIKLKPKIGVEKDPPKAPSITPYEFGEKLILIAEKKASADIFAPYFCDQLNLPVIVNKKSQSFLVFCQKIRGKAITVKDVQIIPNKETNCIENLIIDVSIPWF